MTSHRDPHNARLTLAALAPAAFALFACCTAARATVYVVTANPDMTFTPASITIYQGDAIRFENAGGVHNVHADDNSFICSINCSTENAPSDQPWSVIVRFNQVRSIGYFCDQHGNLQGGMRGAVTVIDRVFVDGFDGTPGP